MVYLLNTNLDNKKKVITSLKQIYGIGYKISFHICDQLGISEHIRINQLSNLQLEKLAALINKKIRIGSELKQEKGKNISRLIKIACYKGFRHTENLPCRGQRTHGNAKTVRKSRVSKK